MGSSEKIISLEIEKLAQGGEGLGRRFGRVVFVPYTLPGERVEVRITREKKDYAEGEIETIVSPSPDRRTPPCPVFTRCGGCQLQHVSEDRQVLYKVEALRENLARVGKAAAFDLLPPVASPLPFHYRTRAQFKVQGKGVGFYRRRSHQIVPIKECPLLVPSLNRALSLIEKEIPLQSLEEVEIQGVHPDGAVLIVLHGKHFRPKELESLYGKIGAVLPLQGLVAYSQGRRDRFGNDSLLQTLLDREIRISDRSFFQVNGAILPLLVRTVRDWVAAGPEDRILELYSGVGTFTLFLAEGAASVTAIEENPAAVEDARWNLDRAAGSRTSNRAGMKHVRLRSASAEVGVRDAVRKKERYTKVFLDPPREGAGRAVLEGLIRLSPEKIFYLSCDPATFARDVRILSARGYRLARLRPFDLFPQTGHLELLAEIVKDGSPSSDEIAFLLA